MTRSILAMLFPRRLGQWFGPLIATGLAVLLLAVVVLSAGWPDLSASVPHPQGWAAILHGVFRRSTAHHAAGIDPPASFGSPRQVTKGAAYYGRVCARCHGGPGLGQNPVALSMTPRPQYLPHEIATFKPAELFWIVKHGVKYSAMPAWPVQDRDDEIWSVVSFLKRMPQMSPAQYRFLAFGNEAKSGAWPGGPDAKAVTRTGYTLPNSTEPPVSSYSYTAPAMGFDDVVQGGSTIAGCAGCHGSDGSGAANGAFPNIALLSRTYLRDALLGFRAGTRHSGYMQTVAVQLSDAQIASVAAYYATQPKRQSQPVDAPPSLIALGERIAAQGDAKRGVGACVTCHGAEGASPRGFSALDGQYAGYLADQLKLFRGGNRGAASGDPMVGAARLLSDREIDAVSLYYASRRPGAPRVKSTVTAAGGTRAPGGG